VRPQDQVGDVVSGLRLLQSDMASNAGVTLVPAAGLPVVDGCDFARIVTWTNDCLKAYEQVQ
jgi:hypothetical protein